MKIIVGCSHGLQLSVQTDLTQHSSSFFLLIYGKNSAGESAGGFLKCELPYIKVNH